jgi:hypothetical protein
MLNRLADIFYQAWDFTEKLPLGYSLAIAWGLLNPYMQFDYDFLGWVGMLFFADTIFGLYKHARSGTASMEGFVKFFDKLVVVVGTVMVIHVLRNYEGGESYFGEFFASGGHFTIMAWLGWSILKNLQQLSGGVFPPTSWFEKLENLFKK